MKQVIIRISDADEQTNKANALSVAEFVEELLEEEGSTITYGEGRWKDQTEYAAVIEVVTGFFIADVDVHLILDHVRLLGQETAFITINNVEAYV